MKRRRARVTHSKINQINKRPAQLLLHTRDGVDYNLSGNYENGVNDPGALKESSAGDDYQEN